MNVLHFFPFFSIHTKGGTEIFIKNLVKYQYEKGFDVQIICPNITEEVKIEYFENIKITYFPFPYGTKDQEFISGKTNHKTNYQFAEIVHEINPDIIHLHGYHLAYYKYFVGLKKEYILLLSPHLISTICPKGNLINSKNEICDGKVEMIKCTQCLSFSRYQRINKELIKNKISLESMLINKFSLFYKFKMFSIVKNVISKLDTIKYFRENFNFDALNPWFYNILLLNGIPSKNIHLFPNPLFERENYTVSTAQEQNTSLLKFLYVGRISVEKGCMMLTEVVENLHELKNDFLIDMIGKIDDENIQQKINELKYLGFKINLLGEVENEQLKYQYQHHDYLLFPSSKLGGEMFPLVLQEAIENDLPVISSDIPGCKQVIKEKVNGFLFKADDIGDFGRILKEVISEKQKMTFSFNKAINIKNKRNQYYENLYLDLIQNKTNIVTKRN